ncbi:MAG: hypothetical protein QNJ57_08930 [Flavobacteriaceae bacterium]|nr:hypothetical protein [Flavobacteriaceae bacterium]
MKKYQKIFALTLVLVMSLISCQEESIITNTDPNADNALVVNSKAADLIAKTTLKDGSDDNILDEANCLTVVLPVNVLVNGIEVTVTSEDDYDLIEDILDESDDDNDVLEIEFPITVIRNDFVEIPVNNQNQLDGLVNSCNGENENDDDIECIDFVYPVQVSLFNTLTEVVEDITVTNDEEFFNLVDDLDDNDVLNIVFPVNLILSDGSEVQANSLQLLENLIEDAEDDCDEDDDFDFDDDDCENCTTNQLEAILTGCTGWFIDKFEVNDNDIEDNFNGFLFDFLSDGTIEINDGTGNFTGSWSAQGGGQNIVVAINVPGYEEEFNGNWNLHEIEDEIDEKKVDLRMPNDDRLRFKNECN